MHQPDQDDDSELVDPRSRETLLQMLRGLLPLLEPLEATALRIAAERCLALLQAPGPLRKSVLAPHVKAVHQQCAGLFRRGAGEMQGTERDVLAGLAEQADQEAGHWDTLQGERRTLH